MNTTTHTEDKFNQDKKQSKLKVKLDTSLYVVPSSAGAFYATASQSSSAQREFMFQLIINNHEHAINKELIQQWAGGKDINSSFKTFYRLQQLGYFYGENMQPQELPQGPLDELLPEVISNLSVNKKAVLADSNGLYLASSGYPHEVSGELAAMSVDLFSLYSRHKKLLERNLNIETGAMAVVAPDGYSQVGFWPLHIGKNSFSLILGGTPNLDHPMFTLLVKLLASKYF